MVWRSLRTRQIARSGLLIVAICATLAVQPPATAAPTAVQRKTVRQAEAALRRADTLIEAGKISEAAALVRRIDSVVAKLQGETDSENGELERLLAPLKRRLSVTRSVLELEGVEFKSPTPGPKKPAPGDDTTSDGAAPPPARISFVRQIAPILVARCIRCHSGTKPKGDLSMDSFARLQQGAGGDAVIQPGNSQDSRIVEVIRAGEMPKEGDKVTRAELATLSIWIEQGAAFDGSNPQLPLRQIVGSTADVVASAKPAGPVAFSTHIAPVLLAQCTGCHGGQRPRNRLDMSTYERLMRGGMTGVAVESGNAASSLLIQKLKGTAADGNRMPLDEPPLPADVIADFEKWIAAGAKFDGPDPTAPVADVAALAMARAATHVQLARQRALAADKNWNLALSDVTPQVFPTENFLVYGSGDGEKLQEIGRLAEQLQGQIRTWLQIPADGPLVKGGLTLFAFDVRVDYSEFVLMVEQRRLTGRHGGHWRYTIVDGYCCLVPARQDEYGLRALLAQQVAGLAIAARGNKPPRWFAEGTARSLAARIDGQDARVQQWNEQLDSLVSQMAMPDDFMTGKLLPEQADVVSYGFVQELMRNDRKFQAILNGLWQGKQLEDVLQATYRQSAADLAAAWVPGRSRRAPR